MANNILRGIRRLLLGGLVLLLVAPRLDAAGAPVAPLAPVKLVVVVVVDGLSWPRLDGYRGWLDGGLARLLSEGQVETECRYAHLNTETGPGHASLSTGAPPRVHGIVANRWFEANPNGQGLRRLYCTDQPDLARVPGQPPLFYREISNDGRIYVFARQRALDLWRLSGEIGNQATTRIGEGPAGESIVFDSDDAIALYNLHHGRPEESLPPSGTVPGPANLRVATLGDRLIEARPDSRVVAFSGKDRGAIFLAGKDPRHAAWWYDRDAGRFVTSSAFDQDGLWGGAVRDLVKRFNSASGGAMLPGRFGLLWRPLPEPTNGASLPAPEPNLGRFQSPDLGIGFDHDLTGDPRGYFGGIYDSPYQDQLLADLALAALADPALKLGRRGVPGLLALSFSAHDVVSHAYGNESAEELDALRRLDFQLGRLLASLDALAKEAPAGRVVLALSADHGFAPLPEVARRRDARRFGGRLMSDPASESAFPSFQERLNRALSEELCLAPGSQPIYGSEGWIVAYDRPTFPKISVEGPCGPAGRAVAIDDLDRVFPGVVRRLFGEEIEEVLLASQRDRWPADDPAVAFAKNDWDADRVRRRVPDSARERPHALGPRPRFGPRLAKRIRHPRAADLLGVAVCRRTALRAERALRVGKLVQFALSDGGQAVVDAVGFVGQSLNQPVAEAAPALPSQVPAEYERLTRGATRLPLVFRFESGSDRLDNKSLRDVGRLLESLSQPANRGRRVLLFGFADALGSPDTNRRLSEARAAAVAGELRSEGVNPEAVAGFGSALPVASNESEEGKGRNRRVEVWLK